MVAIIVLNYISWEQTIKFLCALKKLNGIEKCEIIVVDNCSNNDSFKQLENFQLTKKVRFELLKTEKNGGYAAGNNIGLRYAFKKGYKYGIVMNNDLVINDMSFLDTIISIFNKRSDIAVVSPRILTPDKNEINRHIYKPTVWDMSLGMAVARKENNKIECKSLIDNDCCYSYRAQGCCMALDLEKLNQIDYMSEETFLYSEEDILAERLIRKGYRSVVCLKTSIIHNHSQTVKTIASKRKIIKWRRDSLRIYLIKYRGYSIITSLWCELFMALKIYLFT